MRRLKYLLRFAQVIRDQGLFVALHRTKLILNKKLYNLKQHRARSEARKNMQKNAGSVTGDTRISILMPVYNTDPQVLAETIESVLTQSYQNWELCICDDCSTSHATQEILERYKGSDSRIKITRSPSNLHIANATNLALEFATGQFVTFLDHDDLLEYDALEAVAGSIDRHPDADLLYTDEDKVTAQGVFSDPDHKPDWSPEYLRSVMYIMHLFVIRKGLLLTLGGLRAEFSGAQDYDLALRATRLARQIIHIPQILYHWRMVPGSAAAQIDAKPQALLNARAALEYDVRSEDPNAQVLDGYLPGSFRVMWPIEEETTATLLIPTNAQRADVKDRGDILLVRNLVESIVSKTTWQNYRILVVDNHNLSRDDCSFIESQGGTVIHYSYDGPFNFSKKINFAFRHVDTEHVIILNDDTEIITADWIEALLAFSTRESVGAVGAKLLFANERIQHAGIFLDEHSECIHAYYNLNDIEARSHGFSFFIRNYPAVTGAAMATRMSLVNRLEGFCEDFGTDYNDVDFCLRLGKLGYRSVYTPFAQLYHFEKASIKRTVADSTESELFKSRWGLQP